MMLTLILGPMKSGKSLEMVRRLGHLRFSDVKLAVYQPVKNVRDAGLLSRSGAGLLSCKIESLDEISDTKAEVVGIDEIHMFPPEEMAIIGDLLRRGVAVVVSGLDLDYKGDLFPTIQKLLELGPTEVVYRQAVCESCRQPTACFTQIEKDGEPVLGDLPSVIPEDGTYRYSPRCRNCFRKRSA